MFQVKKLYDSHNYQTGTYARVINQKNEEIPSLILAKGQTIFQLVQYTPVAQLHMMATVVDIKPLLKGEEESSFYVIVLEDKQKLGYRWARVKKRILLQAPWILIKFIRPCYQAVHNTKTTLNFLLRFSREIYAIQSYGFQDDCPIFNPEFIQVIKNATPNDYIVPIYKRNEYLQTQEGVVVATRNNGKLYLGLKYLGAGIASRALSSFDESVQRIYAVQDGLIFKNKNRLEYYAYEDELSDYQILLDTLDSTPREIIQLEKFLYITQVNKHVYLLDLNVHKASLIGVYSVADKIIKVGNNKIFLASTIDNSQLVNVATGEVEKVFKNLGKVQHISFHKNKLITSFQNEKVKSISEQVKIDSTTTITNYEKIPSFSPNIELKQKISKNSTLTLTRDNVLERRDNHGKQSQAQFIKSVSDFQEEGDKVYVSFYFSLNIVVLNMDLTPISTLVRDGEKYSECPCQVEDNSQTSVRGLWSYNQNLFIVQDNGKTTQLLINSENQKHQVNYSFNGLFIKITESQDHLIIIYHNKIVVFSKETFKYFILSKQFVHDLSLEGTSRQFVLTSLKNKRKRVDVFHVDDTPYQLGDLQDNSLVQVSSIHQYNNLIIFLSKQGKYIKIFQNLEDCWNPDQLSQRSLGFASIDAFQTLINDEKIQVYVSGRLENPKNYLLSRYEFNLNGDLLIQFDISLEKPILEILRYEDTILLRDSDFQLNILQDNRLAQYIKSETCRFNLTEVNEKVILRYDYSWYKNELYFSNLALYNQNNLVLYQRFNNLNRLYRVIKKYVLRVPLNDELEVYRIRQQGKRRFLEKIGHSKFNEQITTLQVEDDKLYVGTFRGSIYECQLMNEDQSNIYIEVTKKIEALAKQNQMEIEKQKQEKEREEKEKLEEEQNKIQEEQARIITEEVQEKKKPEYYDKFFAKQVENVGNTFFSRDHFDKIIRRREFGQLEAQLREQFKKLTEYY